MTTTDIISTYSRVNVMVGNGKVVHAAERRTDTLGGETASRATTDCGTGAPYRTPRGTLAVTELPDEAVTCKRCLAMGAK